MFRVEDKYLLPSCDYYSLNERLSAVLPRDGSDSKGYTITSLYFDDLWDTDFNDTRSGNPSRKKHRIRIYNNSLSTIKLEVKIKQYNRILKHSCFISQQEMLALMDGKIISATSDLDNPRTEFNVAIMTRGLRPKIIISYERIAYVYSAGNTRITFDQNIRCSDFVDSFRSGTPIDSDFFLPNNVLEVKYDEFIPSFIQQLLETNSMEQLAFSKYQMCREHYMR